jgi:hypothetical protein
MRVEALDPAPPRSDLLRVAPPEKAEDLGQVFSSTSDLAQVGVAGSSPVVTQRKRLNAEECILA